MTPEIIIKKSYTRISSYIHNTPILTSETFNNDFNSQLFFKCENFQKSGSFKIRGAINSILQLSQKQLHRGVITTSSGNHGAALSLAGKIQNTKVKVIMPKNTSNTKIQNVKRYGGEIIFCDSTFEARQEMLESINKREKMTYISPFDNYNVIAGQGTAALELIKSVPNLDAIIAPISGGGLLSGTILASKQLNPNIKIYGAEPINADDAYQSIKAGKIIKNIIPNTIADGLRAQIGELTFPIISENINKIITVSEDTIIECMKLIWQRLKIVIEPSCSVVLGALINNKDEFKNKKVGLILSGGNVDLDKLPWLN